MLVVMAIVGTDVATPLIRRLMAQEARPLDAPRAVVAPPGSVSALRLDHAWPAALNARVRRRTTHQGRGASAGPCEDPSWEPTPPLGKAIRKSRGVPTGVSASRSRYFSGCSASTAQTAPS